MRASLAELGDPAALAAEWRALEDRARPSPYLSWDWVEAWLTVYRPRRALLVRIGEPGAPVALGVIDASAGKRWQFAGLPVTTQRGLLVAEADRATAWQALGAELRRRRGEWASLRLAGVAPEAAALPGVRLAPMPSWVVDLPDSFDAYLAERSPTQRKGHKQKLRRLEKAGGEVVLVDAAGHAAALERFLALHEARAAVKGERHSQMNDDLAALLGRLGAAGGSHLRVFELRVAGEPAGVSIRLDRGEDGGAWFYNAGFDPEHHRLGPGVLLELGSIRDAIGRGHRRFDLGPGLWRYKTDLGGREDPLFDGQAFSPSARGRAGRLVTGAARRAYAAMPGREVIQSLRRRRG